MSFIFLPEPGGRTTSSLLIEYPVVVPVARFGVEPWVDGRRGRIGAGAWPVPAVGEFVDAVELSVDGGLQREGVESGP